MDKNEIRMELIDMLKEIAKMMNPEESIPHITPETKPLLDLPNFDSLVGILITISCMDKFKFSDDKMQSIFTEEKSKAKKALTVDEVTDIIYDITQKTKQ